MGRRWVLIAARILPPILGICLILILGLCLLLVFPPMLGSRLLKTTSYVVGSVFLIMVSLSVCTSAISAMLSGTSDESKPDEVEQRRRKPSGRMGRWLFLIFVLCPLPVAMAICLLVLFPAMLESTVMKVISYAVGSYFLFTVCFLVWGFIMDALHSTTSSESERSTTEERER